MKMISSTSTTSTSGVMLISDCRPPAVLSTCMMSVSLRLFSGALGDEPHPVEAGRLDGDHGLPDLAEVEARIAFDHDLGFLLVARRGAEAFAEMLGRDRLIV